MRRTRSAGLLGLLTDDTIVKIYLEERDDMPLPLIEGWQESLVIRQHDISFNVDASVTPAGPDIDIFSKVLNLREYLIYSNIQTVI